MTHMKEHIDAVAGAVALVAAVNESLADLARSTGGLDALERAEEQRIRQACGRLLQAAEELGGGELVVAGSTGQARPHPLVKVEQELRREITEALRKLCFCATNRRMCDQANAIARKGGAMPFPTPKPKRSPKAEGKG